MPLYKYVAMTPAGDRISGDFNCDNESDVMAMLRTNSYFPVKIVREDAAAARDLVKTHVYKMKLKEVSIFCRQFHAMLSSGIPVLTCLDILRFQAEKKHSRASVENLYEEVQKGRMLSEAMRSQHGVYPELLISMIEAGEMSGNLDTMIDRMATHYEKEYKIHNKIINAMIYPAVLTVVMLSVISFLLTFVLPTFVQMFNQSGVVLPIPTRILLFLSFILIHYWYLVLIIGGAVIYGGYSYLQSPLGKHSLDRFKLKFPVIGMLTRKVAVSRFARTMSTLLMSGMSLLDALDITARVVNNTVITRGLSDVKDAVRKGSTLFDPLKKMGVFPPMLYSMVKVGEESGRLVDMLDKTSNFFEDEFETAIQKATTLIEPIMIVMMSAIVGFIIISIILPIFDLYTIAGQ